MTIQLGARTRQWWAQIRLSTKLFVDIPEVYKFDLLKQSCCQDVLHSGLKILLFLSISLSQGCKSTHKENTSLGKS